jgi:thiamine biosynthesis lipoprotein
VTPAGPTRCRAAPLAMTVLAILVWGCAKEPAETRYRFTAMGTLVEITIYDSPPAAAKAAVRRVETLFLDLQREWDPWNGGALAALNAAAADGGEVRPDNGLGDLLSRASRISAATGGAFDPAVGQLVRLWGFNDAETLPDQPPSAESIQRILDSMVPLALMWDPDNGVLSAAPGTTIDLGAFAKGEAVDRAVQLLLSAGINNAIVNAGGDLRAIGRHGTRPWKIGVREPRESGVLAAIEISGDETVFTSGDYERYFEYQGRRYHHVLDPRTGYPTRGVASVTVIDAEAAATDAACTALMVAGLRHWPAVASSLGIDQVMVVGEDGAIQMSPAMRERVTLLRDEQPTVEIRIIP